MREPTDHKSLQLSSLLPRSDLALASAWWPRWLHGKHRNLHEGPPMQSHTWTVAKVPSPSPSGGREGLNLTLPGQGNSDIQLRPDLQLKTWVADGKNAVS